MKSATLNLLEHSMAFQVVLKD